MVDKKLPPSEVELNGSNGILPSATKDYTPKESESESRNTRTVITSCPFSSLNFLLSIFLPPRILL